MIGPLVYVLPEHPPREVTLTGDVMDIQDCNQYEYDGRWYILKNNVSRMPIALVRHLADAIICRNALARETP